MGLKKRLLEFIRYLQTDNATFERKAGLANGFINKSGENTRQSSLERIARAYPELNIDWLRTGIGEMIDENHITAENPNTNILAGSYNKHIFQQAGNNNKIKDPEYYKKIEIENIFLKKEIEHLNKLIEEKERLIQTLLNNK